MNKDWRWPSSPMRDAQLNMLRGRDMNAFARLVKVGDKILGPRKEPTPSDLALFDRALYTALHTLDAEPTQSHMMYAHFVVRAQYPHSKAAQLSNLKHVSPLMLPVHGAIQTALRRERDAVAEENQITKKDVLNGFLNAVAVAQTSKDLTEAWREIGRFLGYYEETKIRIEQNVKKEVTHKIEAGTDLRTISDEDLMSVVGSRLLERIQPHKPKTIEHQPAERLQQPLIEDAEYVALSHAGSETPAQSTTRGDGETQGA